MAADRSPPAPSAPSGEAVVLRPDRAARAPCGQAHQARQALRGGGPGARRRGGDWVNAKSPNRRDEAEGAPRRDASPSRPTARMRPRRSTRWSRWSSGTSMTDASAGAVLPGVAASRGLAVGPIALQRSARTVPRAAGRPDEERAALRAAIARPALSCERSARPRRTTMAADDPRVPAGAARGRGADRSGLRSDRARARPADQAWAAALDREIADYARRATTRPSAARAGRPRRSARPGAARAGAGRRRDAARPTDRRRSMSPRS